MTNPNETLIVCLLDRSGSMGMILTDTCGAFDQFIKEQRELEADDKVFVSLYQFDHNHGDPPVETVYQRQPLATVPKLELRPRGTTPLHDALGRTIMDVGTQLAALQEDKRPGKVIFVVMTDGHENASSEYTQQQVKDMVTAQTETYAWEFVFLGAGIDAFEVGAGYGFKRGQTYSVMATGEGVRSGYAGVTHSVASIRRDDGGDGS